MIVVVANYIPPAVRGRLKLWFVEAKANIFVSGIKDSLANDIIEYIIKSCPKKSGLIIFQKIPLAPGFKIWTLGETLKGITEISGYQLVIEKLLKK